MAIEVIKPGLATSVQDAGRPGYYRIGIPLSGALDQHALRAANWLVGNEEGAAVLEATLLGPELIFHAAAFVAVTGAEATPKVNGEARPRNEFFTVRADDRLTFDYMKVGARVLYRGRRRDRRPADPWQPLDLRARCPWRVRRSKTRRRGRAARGPGETRRTRWSRSR